MLKAWTRDVLSRFVSSKLGSHKLIVVSNREPFQHRRAGDQIECVQPASGMASALDPILRASNGLWIAHGSGDADKEMVDSRNSVRVPPETPRYTLRRVWLTEDEEQHYYSGLSNEALWPLCHVAFTRPRFDSRDWDIYRRINQRFADAVLEEAGNEPTFVFIQDYHFGLLPRMLRNGRANLVVAQFWHIPWPNREVFGSFPWREEIIDGMLGNDLLGFHLKQHCQNFLETVDSSLESRVDYATGEVCRGGRCTAVRDFPIGIDFEEHTAVANSVAVKQAVQRWSTQLNLKDRALGIGIDRLDYTKGIPERLRALDRYFELYPEERGKLQFVQIAVPSRSGLTAYRQIREEVDELVQRVNNRWQTPDWTPVTLLKQQYGPADMIALHQLADFCSVTALHDGMNLVAKEYVASRLDCRGALVLSKFAGAARELQDALIVNPFSIDEVAKAYRAALKMPAGEARRRMAKMREAVEDNNVYRWAGKILTSLLRVGFPEDGTGSVQSRPRLRQDTRAIGVAV
jgi:alpha,alpha-trehalose-phosphate synthase [UDP-forming]